MSQVAVFDRLPPCLVCGRRTSNVITCAECQAVYYCSVECENENWLSLNNPDYSHQLWCSKLKAFIQVDPLLRGLPLAFACACSSESFSEQCMAQFLVAHGVFNLGLWKYELRSTVSSSVFGDSSDYPGDELYTFSPLWTVSRLHDRTRLIDMPFSSSAHDDAMLRAYVLPTETIIMCTEPVLCSSDVLQTNSTLVSVNLLDWTSYYTWRGLSTNGATTTSDYSHFSSPLAILMHWPLTIYFILAQLVPKSCPSVIRSVCQSRVLVVHVIGVEYELSMLPVFIELDYLIRSDLKVCLCFIGPKLSKENHESVFHLSRRLSVTVWVGMYDDFLRLCTSADERPDLIIGFNSGLSAYATWTPTLKRIHLLNIPAYFTDACLYSCALGYHVAGRLGIGSNDYHPECSGSIVDDDSACPGVRAPVLNPFRSPIRIQSAGLRWGWFKNAFIYTPISCSAFSPVSIPGDLDILSKMNFLQL